MTEFDTGKLITLDMGGTSCDIGLAVGGGIRFYDFNPVIDRWLVSSPMLHLQIIGAGGGSIARYDRLFKTIEVGPTSSGSEPGPACYDRGGTQATVTDADLLLGYLDPHNYAGGSLKLNSRRSKFVIQENICEDMGMSEIQAARLIKQKVDTNMAHAIFQELGVRGYDPKDFTLLAYGGNGPLHCCGIAGVLEIERIFIPPFSSVFSALGAGIMDQLHIHERNVFINIYDSNTRSVFANYDLFNSVVSELEADGREDLLRQGVAKDDIQFRVELDMRYGNQRTETSVVSPTMHLENVEDVINLIAAFSENYGERFGEGSQSPEAGIRVNTIRVIAFVRLETMRFDKALHSDSLEITPMSERSCHFVNFEQPLLTPVYSLQTLKTGFSIQGPALIESPRTTYLVEPGWQLTMGEQSSAWITKSNREFTH